MSRPVTIDENKNSSEQPSMIGAHVKYVQGAASSALGYETGEQTKQEAVQEMREAKNNSDPPTQSTILGSVEQAAGNLTGCEGMQDEGKSRKATGTGIDESSRVG